jgi:hypothetical protein
MRDYPKDLYTERLSIILGVLYRKGTNTWLVHKQWYQGKIHFLEPSSNTSYVGSNTLFALEL